jgi:hypothetical protein
MRHQFSDEDRHRIRWNCLSASRLNDRMMMAGIRAIEAQRIHANKTEARYQKRREAKRVFTFDCSGIKPPPAFLAGMTFTLGLRPEEPPNAANLFPKV